MLPGYFLCATTAGRVPQCDRLLHVLRLQHTGTCACIREFDWLEETVQTRLSLFCVQLRAALLGCQQRQAPPQVRGIRHNTSRNARLKLSGGLGSFFPPRWLWVGQRSKVHAVIVHSDIIMYAYMYIYIYMYIHVCICAGVCLCICIHMHMWQSILLSWRLHYFFFSLLRCRKEDIARSLIHMVSYNLGYLAYLVGTAHGVRR